MKKKKSGKGKQSRARAIKDLPVSDAKARQAKGGFGIGKALGGGVIKTVAPAVITAVAPTTPS
jgi:hypothetical protein